MNYSRYSAIWLIVLSMVVFAFVLIFIGHGGGRHIDHKITLMRQIGLSLVSYYAETNIQLGKVNYLLAEKGYHEVFHSISTENVDVNQIDINWDGYNNNTIPFLNYDGIRLYGNRIEVK